MLNVRQMYAKCTVNVRKIYAERKPGSYYKDDAKSSGSCGQTILRNPKSGQTLLTTARWI